MHVYHALTSLSLDVTERMEVCISTHARYRTPYASIPLPTYQQACTQFVLSRVSTPDLIRFSIVLVLIRYHGRVLFGLTFTASKCPLRIQYLIAPVDTLNLEATCFTVNSLSWLGNMCISLCATLFCYGEAKHVLSKTGVTL